MKTYVFVLYTIFYIFYYQVFAENEKAMGPYKAIVLNASRCAKPSRPYMRDPPVVFLAEVYNTTKKTNLIRGNITISKENADYQIKSKCYIHENGKWTINVVINSAGCRGVLLAMFTTAIGLEYDRERCLLQKGTFSFENVDNNKIEHAWYSTKNYGMVMCRVEVLAGSQTAECWQFYELIAPL